MLFISFFFIELRLLHFVLFFVLKEELKKENEEEEQDVKLITSIFVFLFNERMCLKKNKTCLKDFSASDEKMMEKKFLVFNPYSLT